MLPGESLLFPVLFELVLSVLGTALTCWLALLYFRRVRLERPAIGTFNRRDIAVVFVFIVGLPLLYKVLPLTPLLVVLGFTFTSALAMGLRPLLGDTRTWLLTGLLIGTNVWLTRTALGYVVGWQVFWIENSVIVIVAAITVANLYVQGGMRLQHVAWFALVLAVYDAVFTLKWPITNELAQRFLGWPFDPAIGFRLGVFNASLGLGDLLVYSLFVIAVLKAYGGRALRVAIPLVVLFGAVAPAVAPLPFRFLIDARTDLVVPAQAVFGPAAFCCYLWLRHRFGPERTMAGYLAASSAPSVAPRREPAVGEPVPAAG